MFDICKKQAVGIEIDFKAATMICAMHKYFTARQQS